MFFPLFIASSILSLIISVLHLDLVCTLSVGLLLSFLFPSIFSLFFLCFLFAFVSIFSFFLFLLLLSFISYSCSYYWLTDFSDLFLFIYLFIHYYYYYFLSSLFCLYSFNTSGHWLGVLSLILYTVSAAWHSSTYSVVSSLWLLMRHSCPLLLLDSSFSVPTYVV